MKKKRSLKRVVLESILRISINQLWVHYDDIITLFNEKESVTNHFSVMSWRNHFTWFTGFNKVIRKNENKIPRGITNLAKIIAWYCKDNQMIYIEVEQALESAKVWMAVLHFVKFCHSVYSYWWPFFRHFYDLREIRSVDHRMKCIIIFQKLQRSVLVPQKFSEYCWNVSVNQIELIVVHVCTCRYSDTVCCDVTLNRNNKKEASHCLLTNKIWMPCFPAQHHNYLQHIVM